MQGSSSLKPGLLTRRSVGGRRSPNRSAKRGRPRKEIGEVEEIKSGSAEDETAESSEEDVPDKRVKREPFLGASHEKDAINKFFEKDIPPRLKKSLHMQYKWKDPAELIIGSVGVLLGDLSQKFDGFQQSVDKRFMKFSEKITEIAAAQQRLQDVQLTIMQTLLSQRPGSDDTNQGRLETPTSTSLTVIKGEIRSSNEDGIEATGIPDSIEANEQPFPTVPSGSGRSKRGQLIAAPPTPLLRNSQLALTNFSGMPSEFPDSSQASSVLAECTWRGITSVKNLEDRYKEVVKAKLRECCRRAVVIACPPNFWFVTDKKRQSPSADIGEQVRAAFPAVRTQNPDLFDSFTQYAGKQFNDLKGNMRKYGLGSLGALREHIEKFWNVWVEKVEREDKRSGTRPMTPREAEIWYGKNKILHLLFEHVIKSGGDIPVQWIGPWSYLVRRWIELDKVFIRDGPVAVDRYGGAREPGCLKLVDKYDNDKLNSEYERLVEKCAQEDDFFLAPEPPFEDVEHKELMSHEAHMAYAPGQMDREQGHNDDMVTGVAGVLQMMPFTVDNPNAPSSLPNAPTRPLYSENRPYRPHPAGPRAFAGDPVRYDHGPPNFSADPQSFQEQAYSQMDQGRPNGFVEAAYGQMEAARYAESGNYSAGTSGEAVAAGVMVQQVAGFAEDAQQQPQFQTTDGAPSEAFSGGFTRPM